MVERFSKKNPVPDKYPSGFENDIWSVFKIMGEFVEGYERMLKIGPCVSIFGSARFPAEHHYYEVTEQIAYELTKLGFGILTGGGPGLMEAANKGAQKGKGKSIGLVIKLPFEDEPNPYIDKRYRIDFNYFFARKVMLVKYAQAFIVMPGGVGTLDEFFESLTLMQTQKIQQFPVVLFGKDYWQGLVDWMKHTMLAQGAISDNDMDLFLLTDSVEEAIRYIADFYETHDMTPNF